MKTFFFRSVRMIGFARFDRACAAAPSAPSSTAASASTSATSSPLEEQLKELDTLTRWPTHRIRSFLVTQSRGVR